MANLMKPLGLMMASISLLSTPAANTTPCDTVKGGYQCQPKISHYWGQYSPFFTVQSDIPNAIPSDCRVTFVQVLSRHGARDPTKSKTDSYNETILNLQANVTSFTGKYSFLVTYKYTLGADQLTEFGEQQLVNSGIQFARRYQNLTYGNEPFVRASSKERVVQSARNWTQGYLSKVHQSSKIPILVISEGPGSNNTLNHELCTQFENGTDSEVGDQAKSEFANTFVPAMQRRLNTDLPGANLSAAQTIHMMDLCPFNTVASSGGNEISPFCDLFTEQEWHAYNYYQTLDKFYGHGNGNPLGPTQGVGFVNELLARMTNSSVSDGTSSNRTLDDSSQTFPLGRKLYADFSHDNDMIGIFSALGLYNDTVQLPKKTIVEANSNKAQGWSAAWTVPFAARAYFEKMTCEGESEELVRAIINGRVVPLENCGADKRGMCTLSEFVKSQGFARAGGDWNKCFT